MSLTDIILIFFKRFLKISSLLFIILILLSSKAFAGVTYVTAVSVADQDTDPRDVQFNTDGTKMFVLGGTGDDVNVYTLSTGFDLTSTVTFVDSYDLSDDLTTNAIPTGLAFNSDGTKMFIAEFSTKDLILEYTLSTGFDLFSTVNFVGSYDAGDQEDQIIDVKFNSDGTKMFVVGWRGDDVNEYTLSTGFDLSTASFAVSFDVSGQELQPYGLAFNNLGTKMYVCGWTGQDVNEYTLTTPFSLVNISGEHTGDIY
jgi:DNA-binding beta-propeller fold protein YncE